MENILTNFKLSIDCMVSHSNAVVSRFVSQAFEQEAVHINLFEFDLRREHLSGSSLHPECSGLK